jgi:hypothetical protein
MIKDNKVFWLTFVTSVILLVASFLLPPTGVIDTSVLTAVGELFAFAALGVGAKAVSKGMSTTVSKGNT